MELICFLLIHQGRAFNREALSGILWPDDDAASAKRYLRQALWKLNAVLPVSPPEKEPVRTQSPGRLQVNSEAVAWADVNAFEHTYGATRELPGDRLSEAEADGVHEAVDLYRGELLSGWHREWCLPDRIRLEQANLAMLEQLMVFHESKHEYAKGIALGRRILDLDDARETTHRQLMRLHHLIGDRAAAIRQYQQCAANMAREFSVRPSPQTVDLYRCIRTDEMPVERPAADGHSTASHLPLARPQADTALAARLDEIQASLRELTRLVLRDRT